MRGRKSYSRVRPDAKTKSPEDRLFNFVRQAVPAWAYQATAKRAKELQMPVSRLIAYALFNELQTGDPFRFEMGPPKGYKKENYAIQGIRLHAILEKEKYGMPPDVLILCSRHWGMEPEEMRGAIQNIIDTKQVALMNLPITAFDYPEGYKWLVAVKNVKRTVDTIMNPRGRPKSKGVLEDI